MVKNKKRMIIMCSTAATAAVISAGTINSVLISKNLKIGKQNDDLISMSDILKYTNKLFSSLNKQEITSNIENPMGKKTTINNVVNGQTYDVEIISWDQKINGTIEYIIKFSKGSNYKNYVGILNGFTSNTHLSVEILLNNFTDKTFTKEPSPRITNARLKTLLNVGAVKTNITDAGHSFIVDKMTLTDNNVATFINIVVTHSNGKTTTKIIKVTLPKSTETIDNEKQAAVDALLNNFTNKILAKEPSHGIANTRLKTLLNVGAVKTNITDAKHSFIVDKNTLTDNNVATSITITITHSNGKTATKIIQVTLPKSDVTIDNEKKDAVDALLKNFTNKTFAKEPSPGITNARLKALLNVGAVKTNITDAKHSFIVDKIALTDNNVATSITITINHSNGKTATKRIQVTLPKSDTTIDKEKQSAVDALLNNFTDKTFTKEPSPGITNARLKALLNVGAVKTNITDAGHSFTVDKKTLTDNNIATFINIVVTHSNGKTTTKIIKVTLPKSNAKI